MKGEAADVYLNGERLVNHWNDYGGVEPRFMCDRKLEHCHNCGRRMEVHIEIGTFRDRQTGLRTYERLHSCPTWFTGWRASRWARGWACPGMGHDSHDADNPMSSRGYR